MSKSEHEIHRGLKNRIKEILEKSGFKVDTEIHVSFSRSFSDDFSLDVCAIYDDQLLLIECKKSDEKLSRQIEHTLSNIPKLNNTTKILAPKKCKITKNDLKKVNEVHCCYAINDTEGKDMSLQKRLQNKGILFWNNEAIKYFYSSSKILGSAEKYEILREFGIKPPSIDTHPEDAVRIEQNGRELFLLGIHPSRLLEMAYAFRRTSLRRDSYQRILSSQKLEQLREFYKNKKNFLLANSVIIAFDEDDDIQESIEWKKTKKILTFPTSYCCAWIIDGQHRVYAFKDTKYRSLKKWEREKFKIPVVAFRTIPPYLQSRTFVNINYYQTKISTILICDLASSFPDATYELSWISLLVKKLNEQDPWKGKIQTTQTEPKGTISIAGFVRPVFLYSLLGYDKRSEKYSGPLAKLAKYAKTGSKTKGKNLTYLAKSATFDKKKSMTKGKNLHSLEIHVQVLVDFFKAVKKNSWNKKTKTLMWDDNENYGLTGTAGVNALLLVLTSILRKEEKAPSDFNKYLSVLKNMDFSKEYIKTLPRGYGAYTTLAENIIKKINKKMKKKYKIKQ